MKKLHEKSCTKKLHERVALKSCMKKVAWKKMDECEVVWSNVLISSAWKKFSDKENNMRKNKSRISTMYFIKAVIIVKCV